jgi:hypothetical protein
VKSFDMPRVANHRHPRVSPLNLQLLASGRTPRKGWTPRRAPVESPVPCLLARPQRREMRCAWAGPSPGHWLIRGCVGTQTRIRRSGSLGVLPAGERLDQSLQAVYLGDEHCQLAAKFDDVFTRAEGILSSRRGGRVLVGLRLQEMPSRRNQRTTVNRDNPT